MADLEISVDDVKQKLDTGVPIVLLDCREPFEHDLARITGAELIPMNSIPQRLSDVERLSDRGQLIVYCHHGVRSLNVVHWLRRNGVENCQSMMGGIDLWSMEIDTSVPRY